MVNPAICRKCSDCGGFDPLERDERGAILCMPLIHCDVGDGTLIGADSDIPMGCPYVLEHKLLEDDMRGLHESWIEEFEEQRHGA